MISSIIAIDLDYEKAETELLFERANICPRCGKGLQPIELSASVYTEKISKCKLATIFNFCTICNNCFITTYSVTKSPYDKAYRTIGTCSSEPSDTFEKKKFSSYISSLSPKFVETYNQAKQAEEMGLNQIAGLGYRKALEFIVKDYAIKNNPDKRNEIEPMFLSFCIKDYIDNPKIKTLAEKSAWLGNDEAHYTKGRADRDISDMKTFINACASYIEMELTVDDANSIQKA